MKAYLARHLRMMAFTTYSVTVVALAMPFAVLLHVRRFAVGIEEQWARRVGDWCDRHNIPN